MHTKTLSRLGFENFESMLAEYAAYCQNRLIRIHTEYAFDQNGNLIDKYINLLEPNKKIRYILYFYDAM